MKRLLCFLAVCASLRGDAWAADPTIVFTTADSPRMSTSSGYIDWAQVALGKGSRLISVFGYNSGPQQWIQFFNSSNGPTFSVSGFSSATGNLTNATGDVPGTGEALQLTATLGGNGAGVYYAIQTATNTFQIASNRVAATSNLFLTMTGASASATVNHVPKHTAAIAGTDNYSTIIPGTGMSFGRGIVVAVSSTGPLYTATGTNITLCATFLP